MYSLSTVWNVNRSHSLIALIEEIKSLGFSSMEINFTFPQSLLAELKANKNLIKVSSVHNYCPALESTYPKIKEAFSLAAIDEEERALAVKHTKISMDNALSLGAKVLVVHLGQVEIICRYREFINLFFKPDPQAKKQAEEVKKIYFREIAEKRDKHFSQVLKSVEEINSYAVKQNIQIGMENRFYPREFPNIDEIDLILKKFKGGNIGYWHDVGHAQVRENVGLEKHEEYLKRYAPFMIGIHLHDVLKGQDHKPPSLGEFDFKRLIPFLKKDIIRVLEIHNIFSAAEVRKGHEFITSCLAE